MQDDTDDLFIRLRHTLVREASDIADRVFHSLGDDTVAAIELVSLLKHFITEDPCIDRLRNFGGTGSLCTVTDHAGNDGHRIDDGMRDLLGTAAVQKSDARPRADT